MFAAARPRTLRLRPLGPRAPLLRRGLGIASDHQVFAVGDVVLLRRLRGDPATILTTELRSHKKVETHNGAIPHSDIIGQRTRKLVTSSKGVQFCVTWPTMDEYVTKVRRLVTPVYPLDAATIVSLLDLHVTPPPGPGADPGSAPPLEILEAGTGHGSLTLSLSRALHAANPPAPHPRRAILHSLDISPKHSAHAQKVVSGFRRGLYTPHVDFHVGTPSTWLADELERRGGEPFLTAAVLDLPAPEKQVGVVARALRPDGVLGVWCPSVTQVGDCLKVIRDGGIRVGRDLVVEFPPHGGGVGAGLREWNVKYAVVRAKARAAEAAGEVAEGGEAVPNGEVAEVGGGEVAEESGGEDKILPKEIPPVEAGESEEVLVCRPSVGDRMAAGGFFAMFRRKGEC